MEKLWLLKIASDTGLTSRWCMLKMLMTADTKGEIAGVRQSFILHMLYTSMGPVKVSVTQETDMLTQHHDNAAS